MPEPDRLGRPAEKVFAYRLSARDRLSARHRRWFDEWRANGQNATQAALAVGYAKSAARSYGSRLLASKPMQEAIKEWTDELGKRAEVEVEEVVSVCVKILRANLLDYCTVDDKGVPRFNLKDVDRDKVAQVAEVTVSPGQYGERVTFKLYDKLAAAEKLFKHLGAYAPQVHEHEHLHRFKKMNRDELEKYARDLAARLGYAPVNGQGAGGDGNGAVEPKQPGPTLELSPVPEAK